ncbi:hypothetical protein TIFTF001_004752 [Ficus carica]|uniref:Uncharacterized protein n=1 Tax=Ficus carica TaxID=3494 RepID=A0AA87ZE09_FICCA|nr:hypothetical protein TIFTF001_004752 [Ficus carica]
MGDRPRGSASVLPPQQATHLIHGFHGLRRVSLDLSLPGSEQGREVNGAPEPFQITSWLVVSRSSESDSPTWVPLGRKPRGKKRSRGRQGGTRERQRWQGRQN